MTLRACSGLLRWVERRLAGRWEYSTGGNGGQLNFTGPSAGNSTPEQETGQKRVMYAAVLTFGSDGFTPSVSFLAPGS